MPRAETFSRSRLGEISCQVEGNLSSTPPAFQSQDRSCCAEALAVAISKAQPNKATLRPHLKVADRLAFGDLGIKRRPLRIGANPLITEPVLNRRRTPVART